MRKIEKSTLLSALWLFILLNIIFRDIHQFLKQSFVESILTGYVDGMQMTDELMLLGGVLALIPISMVLFSLVLKRSIVRPLTGVAALVTGGTLLSATPSDPDDILHLVVEIIAIIAIVWIAWAWRSDQSVSNATL
jgi:hypothetical protein